ncbi:MAG: hypothetical protein V2A74_13300, partial [bacterium]
MRETGTRRLLIKVGWMAVWVLIGFTLVFAVFLLAYQRHMIYFPRSYDAAYLLSAPKSMAELKFKTSQGEQVAFYLPPHAGGDGPPHRVWLTFGGNASVALDWLEFVENFPGGNAGFLLLDYPGYGKCKGKASART